MKINKDLAIQPKVKRYRTPSMTSRRKSSSTKDKENTDTVQKSIIYNPEVNQIQEKLSVINQITTIIQDSTGSKKSENAEEKSSSKSLHEPRLNKLEYYRKILADLKKYTPKEINMNDVSKNTHDIINRAVSSKLNFPTTESVFKNLPKIEDESNKETNRFMQKLQKRSENSTKTKDDIQKLLNEMVEAEYENEEINKRKNVSYKTVDEWLKINKFNEPFLKQPNVKSETEIYNEQLRKDLYRYLFSCDDYISSKVTFDPTSKPNVNKAKDCKCMSDFYTQHSMCS
ncbi:centromere-associated protein E-like [Chironomus tepperi]|uniref:centromere-associated protein E-like n=1 Tax=Chironomus tepperi TaxID=113505 RepID=UPI00391FB0C7